MEIVVNEQLANFLTAHNVINPSQLGFLRGRSCLTYQFHSLNLAIQNVDYYWSSLNIFLNMSKAASRASHL